MSQSKLFGHRLKILRKMRGLSQAEFAQLVGISQKVVSSYERDYRMPAVDKMPLIARVLETSIDYLYGNDTGTPPPETGLKKPTVWMIAELLESLDEEERMAVLRYVEQLIAEKGEKR